MSGVGRMEGMRFAMSDFPEPGGPMSSRLCPPAAATSTARRTPSCPLTSVKSGCSPKPAKANGSVTVGKGAKPGSPDKNRSAASSVSTGTASTPSMSAASCAATRGRMTPLRPARLA